MTNDINDEFNAIDLLYQSGERIKSLKKQCNLIIKKKCPSDILIDYRKKLYSTFITGEHGINDDVIIMFKYAIEKCTMNNEKFNIPFIKKTIYYLEQKNNPDYSLINNWLDYYDINLLNDSVYGNNKYSDREMYYLKKAKTLDLLKREEELKKLLFRYNQEKNKNSEIFFFIKYHICHLNFVNASFTEANEELNELLVLKREKYLLGLPIKYHDYTNQERTALFIIELLMDKHIDDYFYAYILNWIKDSNYKVILEEISDCFEFKDNKYKIINYKKLKKVIISKFLEEKSINSFIKCGKIVKITKLRNAFLFDDSNIFVDKKYVSPKMRIGDTVKYFVIEIFNNEKGCKLPQAVVINIGGNYEVLCSKKRK